MIFYAKKISEKLYLKRVIEKGQGNLGQVAVWPSQIFWLLTQF